MNAKDANAHMMVIYAPEDNVRVDNRVIKTGLELPILQKIRSASVCYEVLGIYAIAKIHKAFGKYQVGLSREDPDKFDRTMARGGPEF